MVLEMWLGLALVPQLRVKGNNGTSCQIGVWGTDEEDESSNYKDLTNLVHCRELFS